MKPNISASCSRCENWSLREQKPSPCHWVDMARRTAGLVDRPAGTQVRLHPPRRKILQPLRGLLAQCRNRKTGKPGHNDGRTCRDIRPDPGGIRSARRAARLRPGFFRPVLRPGLRDGAGSAVADGRTKPGGFGATVRSARPGSPPLRSGAPAHGNGRFREVIVGGNPKGFRCRASRWKPIPRASTRG